MFLTGDPTFVAGAGHDPGRRRGSARVADRAPRTALAARRQGRQRACPLRLRLRCDDGEGRIWGAIVDRVLRRPALSAGLAAAFCWRSPRRRCAAAWQLRAPSRSRRGSRSSRRTTGCSRRFRFRAAGERRRRGAQRGRRRCRARSTSWKHVGARERPRVRADHGRRQRGGHGREHHPPDCRNGTDAA